VSLSRFQTNQTTFVAPEQIHDISGATTAQTINEIMNRNNIRFLGSPWISDGSHRTRVIKMPVTHVLVVDDFLPWQRRVRAMLESRKDVIIVAEAVDGLEAVHKAQELQPDLILLDIGLPTLNGLEAARRIRELCPNSKILFVSNETSAEMAEEALRLGARGYLLKLDAASELMHAMDAILQGEQFVSSRLGPHAITRAGIGLSPDKTQKSAEVESADVKTSRAMEWGVQASRFHEVTSYRDDASFMDGLSHFINAALKKGKPVIAITTEAHRGGIRRRLQGRGWDVAAAIQEGIYISLDVDETLSTFMINDWPDATRLFGIAGNLIREAVKKAKSEPRRVAICGECAPILWAQGKTEAAIQLEKLWDTIARRHDVDILCGYTLTGLRRSENSRILERIRAEHSAAYSD
jgi:DNA-binding NarL/FixJ family response regulator